jgi:hypothetical protein
MKLLLPVALLCIYGGTHFMLGASKDRNENKIVSQHEVCKYWLSRIDSNVKQTDQFKRVDESNIENIIVGAECLLALEGNKNRARFSGATRHDVSQLFAPATVDIAALYYISFLFTQKWDHADAVAIVDKEGRINTDESIKEAFQAYREWFKEVKKLGIHKARERGIDPFAGKNIRWY